MYDSNIQLANGYTIEERLAQFTEHECHMHDALEISVPLDNAMKYPLGNEMYCASPGDVFLLRPFEPHWNLIQEEGRPGRWVMLLFFPSIVGQVPNGYSLLTPFYTKDISPLIPAASPHAMNVHRLVLAAMEERRTALPGWELQHYSLLIQILVHIHRYFMEQMVENSVDTAAFSGIIEAVEYMMEHWSEEIDMDALIGRSQLKKTWFYTKFKAITGLTPLAFTVRLRLQYASQQLRATNHSVTDIALSCGFGSSSYFNKVFREFRGMTPGEFRKQL
ncbi:helix-turn-helix transcriptional regulator [Paenibacillus nasutitermitis]|uniref:HTH araC/xylS-type domain-containing protein n=1 Tax=Paenibacillus nasutitermitis TaxID=1652958 RepID=A0A916YND1_9BACL|nr:AraC family transcriptional regulator [Paenibacillus nasutitermitis]GGD53597.1 hypothetical protein GCM10010911_08930 [Paenibacillus nasutitermitis]